MGDPPHDRERSRVMANPTYPPGVVRRLLATDLVTPPTRAALQARLDEAASSDPRFFDPTAYTTLHAACARLIPQPGRVPPIDLARDIDRRLAEGGSDGWRYDRMPPDREAYRLGLRGLDETARTMFGADFAVLDGPHQDAVLAAVQRAEAPGASWTRLPADRFFEELLGECVEGYYSHPLAQEEIGYVGMADAHGWQAVGLDQLAPHEPRPLGEGQHD